MIVLGPSQERSATVMDVLSPTFIEVRFGDATEKVHLRGVHVAEPEKALGREAKNCVLRLALGEQVTVKESGRCAEGHAICVITLPNGQTLQSELVRAGLAWRCKEVEDAELSQLEEEARAAKRGVWAEGMHLCDAAHGHPNDPSAWNEAYYAQYNHETFRQFAPANKPLDPAAIDYELLSAALFFATNEERAKHGKSLFAYSRALTRAACEHSRSMMVNGFFSHDNPVDPRQRTVEQRLKRLGVPEGMYAENIVSGKVAKNPPDTYISFARAALAKWMASSGHRANILNADLRFLGCGAYECGKACFHIGATQDFSAAASDGVMTAPSR